MSAIAEKTVRELALENPDATRVFEKLGIDYCCGGNKSLDEACRAANLQVNEVLSSLEAAKQATQDAHDAANGHNWQAEPLAALIAHIKSTHHKYVREETSRLAPLFEKVCAVHGKNHAELFDIRDSFRALSDELRLHLMKEEMVLFPYIVRMEESITEHTSVLPAPFGSVANPISMMTEEHEAAGNALRFIRQASGGYTAPADGCVSYKTLYQALSAFEADLHQHIHLENNVLFPRAAALEGANCN